jgi:diguanylate cyclase (GGDEF)-like protein
MFGPEVPPWLKSLGAFPLRRGQNVIGVLTVVFERAHELTLTEQRLLSALADQAAIAVYNAQLHEQAERNARTDSLTGLANRRRFDEVLTAEVRRSQRNRTPISLMMIDLDRFKDCNDKYGHAAGDLILRQFAELLRQQSRVSDLLVRFGGDEFVVMLNELQVNRSESLEQARAIAEKIRCALFEAYELTARHGDAREISVTHRSAASIGVALFWGHIGTEEDVLKWADAAMYRAKAAGRNTVVFHEPDFSSAPAELTPESE